MNDNRETGEAETEWWLVQLVAHNGAEPGRLPLPTRAAYREVTSGP